jgi:predicted RNase H-like nuclease (RuvC/YqgF family)
MNQDVAELRKQLAALVYVGHGSSEENTKRNKALIQRNALAQQSLYVKLQAIATKYQTENTALDKQITQLHDERSKLESRLSKLGLVAKNPDSTSEYYEQIVKERRFREIDSEIENKTNRINDNIDRMNREMAELQKQAEEIGDSPLNAFARQSLHINMQAIASKYQMENTALNLKPTVEEPNRGRKSGKVRDPEPKEEYPMGESKRKRAKHEEALWGCSGV